MDVRGKGAPKIRGWWGILAILLVLQQLGDAYSF